MSLSEFQKQARLMVSKSKELNTKLSYQQALELIASVNGYSTWIALKKSLEKQQKQPQENKKDFLRYMKLDYFVHIGNNGSFYVLINQKEYNLFVKKFYKKHNSNLDEHGLIIEYAVITNQISEEDSQYIFDIDELERNEFPEHLLLTKYKCEKCSFDLTKSNSVLREYVNKNENKPSVFGLGHYNAEGDYIEDTSPKFDHSCSYDLLDNSDFCTKCYPIKK